MIEVHPILSEAPHLRSSVSHSESDFSKESHCIPTRPPVGQAHEHAIVRNTIGISVILD